MAAQPPGIRPSALRVATHGQQVASLYGGRAYPSAEVQSRYSTAPADRAAYCSGRVPILVHPSLYRSLKLRFPIDVGGITRDNRVTTELGTGSLCKAVGILTPKDFRPVVDTE